MRIIIYFVLTWFFQSSVLSKDLYVTKEYNIEFVSENLQLKKNEYLNSIKKEGFVKLLSLFLKNYERNALAKDINTDFVNSFIFSIDIYEEKINNNNYSSKVKIAYDNSKIIDYFISNDINFVPYQPEKFLLIIYDQKLFSEKILTSENSFYKYLSNNKNLFEYFTIPKLDINDRFIIKKNDFISKKIKNYEKLINKYNNPNILLIHSINDLSGIHINSYIYKDDNFILLDDTFFSEINYEVFFANLNKKLIEYWKNTNLVNVSKKNIIKCRIKTLNLIELKKIKEIIMNNTMIRNLSANKISFNNSIYDLIYIGDLNILKNSLNYQKVELKLNNKKCNIKIL